uniref:Uncharacterized protein n=1 Tax=Trichuris muris TaxID=70415 RepID=A0A5S6Q9W2_TRIMR
MAKPAGGTFAEECVQPFRTLANFNVGNLKAGEPRSVFNFESSDDEYMPSLRSSLRRMKQWTTTGSIDDSLAEADDTASPAVSYGRRQVCNVFNPKSVSSLPIEDFLGSTGRSCCTQFYQRTNKGRIGENGR